MTTVSVGCQKRQPSLTVDTDGRQRRPSVSARVSWPVVRNCHPRIHHVPHNFFGNKRMPFIIPVFHSGISEYVAFKLTGDMGPSSRRLPQVALTNYQNNTANIIIRWYRHRKSQGPKPRYSFFKHSHSLRNLLILRKRQIM